MKQIYLLIFSILFFACNNKQQNVEASISSIEKEYFKLKLVNDSGFIQKKDGLLFLLSHGLTDTTDSHLDLMNDKDTIGKYYKVKQTGNFFYCLIGFSEGFETHILFETKPDGTLLKSERFYHGNYSCCWDNYYEGFNKNGNYFSIKTCGTGSGYCGSHIYLFKNIIAQDQQNSIPEYYWASSVGGHDAETDGPICHSLSSTIEFKLDYILMHYKLEKGVLGDSLDFRIRSTEKFDVKFIMKNGMWEATDSTKLNMLDM